METTRSSCNKEVLSMMAASKDFSRSKSRMFSYDPVQYKQQLVNERSLQSRRLGDDSKGLPARVILLEEKTEATSSYSTPTETANLQTLFESFQIMKNAINYFNYQDSTEQTARVLPEITKLLGDTDITVVGEAAALMHQLAKKEPSRHAIIGTQNVVTAIVHVIANTNDPDIQRNISGALCHLSKDRQGLISIYNSGGIPHLVQLLTSSVDAVLFFAMTTLHNLLEHYVPSKMAISFAGGLEKMVTLLSKDNVKFLTIMIDCLYMLAYRHQDRKLIIFSYGGSTQLVRVMRSYTFEKLLLTSTKLLKVLSVCKSNKPEIIQAGGMQVLAMLLNHDNECLVQNVLWILRNLSDVGNKQDNLDSLLYMLIDLLYSSADNVVLCAAGILSNLTCNNAKNKVMVTQMHGTEALVHALINAGDQEEIIDPAVCALRHLTSRHSRAEEARKIVRTHNGITALASILKSPISQQSLVKAASGLIMNLLLSTDNHKALEKNDLLQYVLKKTI